VSAAVRIEGLRRRPEALRAEGPSAVLRGVLPAAGLVLTFDAGRQAQAVLFPYQREKK
jgi:hypothetical protein